VSVGVGLCQDIGDRPEQQDRAAFSDSGTRSLVRDGSVLGVVADGMGGMKFGASAAQTAVAEFLKAFEALGIEESIPQALTRALDKANQAVVEFARQQRADGETASTLVAAVVRGHQLYWISAGDSRCYLLRGGWLYRITTDHNLATQLDADAAAGRIDISEAFAHPDRQSLTSYIGMPEQPMADRSLNPYPLICGDRVLLCSDGVYGALTEAEIAACCRTGSAQACCDLLVREVKRRAIPGQDNMTALMLEAAGVKQYPSWLGFALLMILAVLIVLLTVRIAARLEILPQVWAWSLNPPIHRATVSISALFYIPGAVRAI